MDIKLISRPALAVIFGFLGALAAKNFASGTIFDSTPRYLMLIIALAFSTLGFLLPDILELGAKAGIAVVAKQIVGYFPIKSGAFRLNKRQKHSKKQINPLIVDTSVLIDGRIIEIVRTGFVYGTFIVIPAVISELHMLSDSADGNKRARGRLGLENLAILQKIKKIKVELVSVNPEEKTVDSMLLKLAKKIKGSVVTVDYNLNKVGQVQGIHILNINELANAVKTVVLPNEVIRIRISGSGKEKDQGVGYLADGTMVVVAGGSKYQDKTMDVTVVKVLQTNAGKMIFAKIGS